MPINGRWTGFVVDKSLSVFELAIETYREILTRIIGHLNTGYIGSILI